MRRSTLLFFQTIAFVGCSAAFAEIYKCTFKVFGSGNHAEGEFEFDGSTPLEGIQLAGVEFFVYPNSLKTGEKTIQLVIVSRSVKTGAVAPMGTPWVYAVNDTHEAYAMCKLK